MYGVVCLCHFSPATYPCPSGRKHLVNNDLKDDSNGDGALEMRKSVTMSLERGGSRPYSYAPCANVEDR